MGHRILQSFTRALVVLASSSLAQAASNEQWRSRSIYQVLTDRFALSNGSTSVPCDSSLGIYCGGTWQGLRNKLDYIQGMGFDAIWISPPTRQMEGNSLDGESYHGYWQQDLYSLNPHFGDASDLRALSEDLHARGMYLMVDVVTNHFAWNGASSNVNYSKFFPFNEQAYFHNYCAIDYNDVYNTTNMETCWEGDQIVCLPDLRTEDAVVQAVFSEWIAQLVGNYSIDGLRIDSVLEVEPEFWAGFQASANVYSVGEAYNGDSSLVCSFQNYLPGVMNYATYFPLRSAFESTSGNISALASMLDAVQIDCQDPSLLGTFSENHDQPRFASLTQDWSLAKNIMAFTMLTDGIPIIYEGQEQHYDAEGGSSVPYNREAIWLSKYNTEAPLYQHATSLNAIRKNAIRHDSSFVTAPTKHVYTDQSTIAVQKGHLLSVLSNLGAGSSNYTFDLPSKYAGGIEVIELLTCSSLTVSKNGTLSVPMSQGLPRIYYPASSLAYGAPCASSCDNSTSSSDESIFTFARAADAQNEAIYQPRRHGNIWAAPGQKL